MLLSELCLYLLSLINFGFTNSSICFIPFFMMTQFLKIISEDDNETSSHKSSQERVLAVTVDSMAMRLETDSASAELKQHESQNVSNSKTMHKSSEDIFGPSESPDLTNYKMEFKRKVEESNQSGSACDRKSILGEVLVNYQRKVTLLFELLSVCVADTPEDSNEGPRLKKGYDARLRTALRLLAIWLDIKWIKMVCISRPFLLHIWMHLRYG